MCRLCLGNPSPLRSAHDERLHFNTIENDVPLTRHAVLLLSVCYILDSPLSPINSACHRLGI